jgi:hypothetical protein
VQERSDIVIENGMADVDGHWHADSALLCRCSCAPELREVFNQRVEYEHNNTHRSGWIIGTERIATTRSERGVE